MKQILYRSFKKKLNPVKVSAKDAENTRQQTFCVVKKSFASKCPIVIPV